MPDAPSGIAVYNIRTTELEVRWSTSDAASTTSFKVQWKSGSEEFNSSRQITSDPTTSIEAVQSTSAGDRYVEVLTGLTDGTEYTVRVIATNSNGDSDASDEAMGTPQSSPGQEMQFIRTEVIEILEGSHPWLRETWDFITSQNAVVEFTPGEGGAVGRTCSDHIQEDNLRKCNLGGSFVDGVEIGRYEPRLIYIAIHELAHVYTLINGVASTPGPLGVAHLYFHDLISDPSSSGIVCTPNELYADALSIVTLGDGIVGYTAYWKDCSDITETVSQAALAVVRSAASGEMPSWFSDTYNDSEGNPDLERVWMDVKLVGELQDQIAIVFQLHDSFSGYCNNLRATESAFGSRVIYNPWKDGGCVPDAPASVSATANGSGKLIVVWEDTVYDGGSPLKGYKIWWKSDTQEYHSSRQAEVTDLTKLWNTITGLTFNQRHTIEVRAYNQNGDGEGAETTATPVATDTTAPELLAARIGSDELVVRLTYNEALDSTSEPPATAFIVSVNGVNKTPSVDMQGNLVTLTFSVTGGAVAPTDVVTVSYTAPTGSGATPLKDSDGNNAADLSAQIVRNDKSRITFISDPGSDNTYSWNNGSGSQDEIEATVAFSEPVVVRGVPKLRLEIGGETRRAAYHSGSGTASLAFRYPVDLGETDSDGIDVERGTIEGLIRYASTNAVAPGWVRTNPGVTFPVHYVDGVRPTLVSADILAGQNDLTLTWDKVLDEDSVPPPRPQGSFILRGFYVFDRDAKMEIEVSTITIEGNQVSLTLSSTVSATDRITVSFREPSTNPLKDTLGNYAEPTTAFPVSVARHPNNPPEFPSTEDGARSVDENTPAGRNIGDPIAATDADSAPRTYSLSGMDAEFFEVVSTSGQLRTKSPLDHEGKGSYSFTMSVSDSRNIYGKADTTIDDTISVTVTVNDVNEPPEVSGATTIEDYDENGSGIVATYTATDPEGGTTFNWSLGGQDSGDFDITGGVLTFKNAPDHENPADSGRDNHYEVVVQASDANNNRGGLDVDVFVTNVDEPPELIGPDTVDDFPENSSIGRQVARFTATDPEGAMVTLGLLSGDSDFVLAGNGVLTFREPPDFEEQSNFSVTVSAAAGSHTVNKVVVVNIQNVEEPGSVSLSHVQPQEGINFVATLEDDDEPAGITWQWYRTSSRSSDGTSISGADSRNYTPDAADVGSYLRVVASYNDGHGDGKSATAISANRVQEAPPAPEPPVFPADGNYSRSIRENLPGGRSVGTPVTATDGNNDSLIYSIPTSDDFEIVESTGQLLTKAELDHEDQDQHFITVTATDPGGLTDTVTVTITVENVDETPEVSGPTNPEVTENGNTEVATYTATDPDNKGIDWVLTGTDSNEFTLSGSGLSRSLTFNDTPDYEEKNQYGVTIEVREQGDGTSIGRLNITVRVANVDEPGMLTTTAKVDEPRVGQTLRLNVEDEDGGENVIEWKWEKGVPNSPCGTVDSPTVTTWETISGAKGSSYTPTNADQGHCIGVTVLYNDRAGTGRTEQFLTPNSVEAGPFFTQGPPTFRMRENTAEGTFVGRVQARHSNGGESLTYSLTGGDTSYFTVDNTGQLKTSATPLDYESQPGEEAVVEITARDNNSRTATITVTISVIDECTSSGEPPCAPSSPGVSSESDTSLRITWSAPGTPSGTSITGYQLQYRESDGGGSWIPQSVSGTDTVHTIENLIKDTTYEVQVRATSDHGVTSGWSSSGTGRPGYVPPPPPPPPPPREEPPLPPPPPANTDPVFHDIETGRRLLDENTAAGESIGRPVSAWDPQQDTLAYSLGGRDAASFDIDTATGQLFTKDPLDYEAKSSYWIIVWVQDGKDSDGNEHDATDIFEDVNIIVRNVDEAGKLNLSSDEPQAGTELTAVIDDIDGGVTGEIWKWERSTDMSAWRVMDGTHSEAYTPSETDLGTYLRVTVTYSDGHGPGKSASVSPSSPVVRNAGPRFPQPSLDEKSVQNDTLERTISEYASPGDDVGDPVTAIDPDGDTLTYILSGDDAGYFELERTTGQLTTRFALDFESKSSYSITVSARDGKDADGNLDSAIDDSAVVSVVVVNESERGTIALSTLNPRVGSSLVAVLTDPDGVVGDVEWVWHRTTDPETIWETDWRVIAGAESASYTPVEGDLGYYLRATAIYDDGYAPDNRRRTISQAEVGEFPGPIFPESKTGDGSHLTRSVAESARAGAEVGMPVVAESPNGGPMTYSLSGEDADLFAIDSRTGQISVKEGAEFDYESGKNTYTIWVTATDRTGVASTATVVIQVSDVELTGIGLRYDTSGNEIIDREEAIAAVTDYFRGLLSKDETVEVIRLYFTG